MPTRAIDLTDHLDRFIESGIAAGRYRDASELVHAALRLLEQHEERHQRFLAAIQDGIDADERGDVTILEDGELDAFIDRIGREVQDGNPPRRTGT